MDWEAILDRIIRLREEEGVKVKLIIQVDTLCHRLPNFVLIGPGRVTRVFIGLETNPPRHRDHQVRAAVGHPGVLPPDGAPGIGGSQDPAIQGAGMDTDLTSMTWSTW